MATLVVKNNTSVAVTIPDVGVQIPGSGQDTFTRIRDLMDFGASQDTRDLVNASTLTLNDGAGDLTQAEAITYLDSFLGWIQDGSDQEAETRVIASGTTVIGANSTVTLATFTRRTKERFSIAVFVQENVASLAFSEGLGTLGSDSVCGFFERTATANQVLARAKNSNLASSRTLEWIVIGIRIS